MQQEPTVIEGVVTRGRQLGRRLGFPTANMEVGREVTAEAGVYASEAEVNGRRYRAMSNLGSNPTVGGTPRHLETHLFDFAGDLSGRPMRVRLLKKIREERRFASLDELRRQIEADYRRIRDMEPTI